jgi:hypothetical protein
MDTPPYRPTQPSSPFLLAADIDGTLLGDEQGAAWLQALSLAYPSSFYLALVTGRSLPSILTLLEEGRLPQPDYICCDVGTELLDCADPENGLGKKYAAQVSPQWDLEKIYALGEGEGVWRQDFYILPSYQIYIDVLPLPLVCQRPRRIEDRRLRSLACSQPLIRGVLDGLRYFGFIEEISG